MKPQLRNLANLPEHELADLQNQVAEHWTLEDIFKWSRRVGTYDGTEDLIVQDEFTHDAVFPYRKGLFLVYGVT